MKRLMVSLMVLFFFLLIGCEKDEVVAPEVKDEVKQTEELDAATEDKTSVAAEDQESTEKKDGSENSEDSTTTKVEAPKTSQSVDTKSDQTTQRESTKTAPINKETQTKPSTSSTTKETSTQSKIEETPVESKPKQEEPAEPKPTAEPTKPAAEPTTPKQTVTITITAPDVKGTILPVTTVEMAAGDTVLAITQKIVKARGIQISVRGSNSTAYVEGIDNLYEFDHGPLSGWEAFVDGQTLDRSAGAYGVQPGQAIMWRYTKNYME